MKPSFHPRILNGPFEDPGLYIRLLRERRALLFDLGFTASLSIRDVLKIGDIFVSHAHIDHFIGFDSILRFLLKRRAPLRLFGPEGFTNHVEGKLKGYTWNLAGDYPLVIEALEISERGIAKTVFSAETSFVREERETQPFQGVLVKNSFYTVSAAVLSHEIPCLAFSLEEDYHINIDKDKLNRLGLSIGPWLREFKHAFRQDRADTVITVDNREVPFTELRDIANVTRGQKISYVVDVIGSNENIQKITDLVRGSDLLYIEAYFLHRDRDKAEQRYHLTARQAGKIAREAGVKKMVVFHFSPRYMGNLGELIQEAEEEFRGSKM